jgi:hypothetical protein
MEFVYAERIFGKVLMAAGCLIGVGGYWLWADFIAPATKADIGS